MVAAKRFLDDISLNPRASEVVRLRAFLYGSLAYTGKGHSSDKAVVLGMLGEMPETLDPDNVDNLLERASTEKTVNIPGRNSVAFSPEDDVVFDFDTHAEGHANAMKFVALDKDGEEILDQMYYSIGGGFVVDHDELHAYQDKDAESEFAGIPFPFQNAAEMLEMGQVAGLSIIEMKRANERSARDEKDIDAGLDALWDTMNASIERGMRTEGKLPGGLDVKRRAKCITDKLRSDRSNEKFAHTVMDWISVYAMAVNEENAAGGRIITAPTNGAAGIVPAVIRYYLDFCPSADQQGVRDFLLVAATIGGLIKHNASISGAEVGCQGEVGSASAMAAAGLAAVLGGSNEQVENAAEIALEHHLGMTCDPIGGLVQVPCIERNALGAVKAISAASLSLKGDGTHFVPLDSAIKTMRETGHDMLTKYKETSEGGLAVNVTEC